jgi:HB1/ASXL restriction endonuclease-like protein with HTH domain
MSTKKSRKARPGQASESAKVRRTAKTAPPTEKPKGKTASKKLSALDAAARVLGETGEAMNCKELIETMAAKGYWTSPKGKTPQATLYAAILREINAKGKDARFKKTERGKFTLAKREG